MTARKSTKREGKTASLTTTTPASSSARGGTKVEVTKIGSNVSAQRLELSRHFRERWDKRGDSRLPREAVRLAAEVPPEAGASSEGYDADELRVYASGRVNEPLGFPIRERTVVTATPLRATVRPPCLERCPQCGGVHRFVTETGCPYCSSTVRNIQEDL